MHTCDGTPPLMNASTLRTSLRSGYQIFGFRRAKGLGLGFAFPNPPKPSPAVVGVPHLYRLFEIFFNESFP